MVEAAELVLGFAKTSSKRGCSCQPIHFNKRGTSGLPGELVVDERGLLAELAGKVVLAGVEPTAQELSQEVRCSAFVEAGSEVELKVSGRLLSSSVLRTIG